MKYTVKKVGVFWILSGSDGREIGKFLKQQKADNMQYYLERAYKQGVQDGRVNTLNNIQEKLKDC